MAFLVGTFNETHYKSMHDKYQAFAMAFLASARPLLARSPVSDKYQAFAMAFLALGVVRYFSFHVL